MLFDLQGKRRRFVQVTYLTLAVLMGGGLVLTGVGSDAPGGLIDAFTGGGGDEDAGDEATRDRIERNEELARTPARAEGAYKELVRDYYQLAVAQTPSGSTEVSEDAIDELRRAASNWQAYLKLEPERVDSGVARVALQVYDPAALNRPEEAQEAARVIAEVENDSNSYLNLVQYAVLAGDTRTADLAGTKAIDLAPKDQRSAVRSQVEQIKNPPSQGGAGATQGGAAPGGG